MFRSATFKLTLWYVALAMFISLVFSVTLYNVATSELRRGLHQETQRIYHQFPIFQNNPAMPPPDSDYAGGAHRILLRLAAFNVVVFIGSGFAGYFLARRTLEPIETAHRQQKRFTADVSHELRTPLTALRMESEVALLNKSTSKQELRRTLDSNLEEITKIEGLINNLLRLTSLEADELQQSFKPLDNAKLVTEALARIEASAKSHNIKLVSNVTPAIVDGDSGSLVQLLVILLDNAIKYSPSGQTVEIQSRQTDDQVTFSIQDHGSGIEPGALEHVFDRFYRADTSRTKQGAEGYGLGLSIAEMITNHHQGSITLSSRPKHGTLAIVSLPLSKPNRSSATDAASA